MITLTLGGTFVSLALETTGLDPDQDQIIEVGAVKFRGGQVLDTFHSLVNPYRALPQLTGQLTGLTARELEAAPPFAAVARELVPFLGDAPLVGHNVAFHLAFLSGHGLRLSNPAHDTFDLASLLLPRATDLSLQGVARELGLAPEIPHRALPSARAVHQVFLALLERLSHLDPGLLGTLRSLSRRGQWPLYRLLDSLERDLTLRSPAVGLTGLDLSRLAQRMARPRGSVRKVIPQPEMEALSAILEPGGLMSQHFPGYDFRPQQVEMMKRVAQALFEGRHLVVEGGTGIGKSVAYLLPAILFSLSQGKRVVVSTNTINLQEQLLKKDIPGLVHVLEEGGLIPRGEFRAVPLKGRANYLCLRRFSQLMRTDPLSAAEARLLGKALLWLHNGGTGDRAEVNLAGREAFLWHRISADDKRSCQGGLDGLCFLRSARERAYTAHLVVVNHALLLSDLAQGGGVLPEYQHLIIDEAHNLEEEATQQFGFVVPQGQLAEELDSLGRLLDQVRFLSRAQRSQGPREAAEQAIARVEEVLPRARDAWGRLWGALGTFMREHGQVSDDYPQLSIQPSTRAQPAWSDLEVAWEDADASLGEMVRQVERLRQPLEAMASQLADQAQLLAAELEDWLQGLQELREKLKLVLVSPEEQQVYWASQDGSGDSLALHSAPLDVSPLLKEKLFGQKESVVLTSATLATAGGFGHLRQRLGLEEADELQVGSPFDYKQAALLMVPSDMPSPDSPHYQPAVQSLLLELALALDGHTLALFTSHSALQAARKGIRDALHSRGIRVLAQGVDGTPRQLMEAFAREPRAVLLGTSSFWEGVDLAGGLLRALVIARLPFDVPTEPVFAARSAQYEEPFRQYALPQAILRFRQGFGRLIRGKDDRGVVLVLDGRIISRGYGAMFLRSIPPCTMKKVSWNAVTRLALEWVGRVGGDGEGGEKGDRGWRGEVRE